MLSSVQQMNQKPETSITCLQVLSVSSTDPSAPLLLTPARDGDPSQLWHQDHWRQFGNHKVTSTLGLQDIDHVNKEAFVLINK